MNILLTVDQTDFVQTQLESGQFSSPEEVIAIDLPGKVEAIDLLSERLSQRLMG